MENTKRETWLVIGMVLAAAVFVFWQSWKYERADASGLPAVTVTVGLNHASASSTTKTLIPQAATQLLGTTTCASRIISTAQNDIRLTFNDGITPTASLGTLQTASTTVVYDREVYGCGATKAFSLNSAAANSFITIMETQ